MESFNVIEFLTKVYIFHFNAMALLRNYNYNVDNAERHIPIYQPITSLAGIQIFIISGKARQQYLPQQRGSLIQGSITIHSDLQVKLLVSMNLKIINLRQESANT